MIFSGPIKRQHIAVPWLLRFVVQTLGATELHIADQTGLNCFRPAGTFVAWVDMA